MRINFIVYLLIANLLVIISNIPLFIKIARTPPHLTYPLVHATWAHDYYLYLSAITQGQAGNWLYQDAYTSEPTTPGIFYIFYVFVGKATSLFKLSPSYAYHLATILSAELFILATFFLAYQFLGKRLAFWGGFFALLSTSSPHLLLDRTSAFPFGINMDVLDRIYNIPHYLFAEALLLSSICLTIYYLRKRRLRYAVYASIVISIGGVVFPAILLPIVFALPLAVSVLLIRNSVLSNKFVFNLKPTWGIIIILLTASFSALSIKLQERMGFPWNIWAPYNMARWNQYEPNFNLYLFFSFGILPIISLPALVKILRSKSVEYIFICLWAYLPFLLLPFVNIFQIPKLRLVQEAPFVPWGILAAITIFKIVPKNKSLLKALLVIIFLATTLPVSFTLLARKVEFAKNELIDDVRTWHIFIPNQEIKAIDFIKRNIKKGSIMLSDQRVGNITPAFAPVVSYFGHQALTKDFSLKQKAVELFFSQTFGSGQAREFLTSNNISYVYYGLNEKALGQERPLGYNFLKSIYQSEGIEIYQVL